MSANHLISVIIPTYNYGHRLLTALTSLRDQCDHNIEVIIIDDGSTDDTSEIVKAFQRDNPTLNCHYYYQNNKGVGAARNLGILKSTGAYILPLDADDYLLTNSFALFRHAINATPEAGFIAAGHMSYQEKKNQLKKHFFSLELTDSKEKNFLNYLRKKISLVPGASLYKKEIFTKIHYPENVKNAEDLSVFFQVLATERSISIYDPVVVHNKHEDSLRHQFEYQKKAGPNIVDIIFDKNILPACYFKYRKEYLSLRFLSLARMAYRQKAYKEVIEYYKHGIITYPKHVLKMSFKKYLLSYFYQLLA